MAEEKNIQLSDEDVNRIADVLAEKLLGAKVKEADLPKPVVPKKDNDATTQVKKKRGRPRKNLVENTEKPTPKKRGRPPKKQPEQLSKAQTQITILEDDDIPQEPTNERVEHKPRRTKIVPLNKQDPNKPKQPCRIEPLGQFKNNFNPSDYKDKYRQDAELDKKLWGKNQPEERNRSSMCSINCRKCNTECIVPIKIVAHDTDTNTYEYICDRCIGAK